MGKRVLIADDIVAVRKILVKALDRTEFELAGEVSTAEELFEKLPGFKPDLLIIDTIMPGRDPLEVIAELREKKPEIKIIALVLEGDEERGLKAMDAGAAFVLKKPFSPGEASAALQNIFQWTEKD